MGHGLGLIRFNGIGLQVFHLEVMDLHKNGGACSFSVRDWGDQDLAGFGRGLGKKEILCNFWKLMKLVGVIEFVECFS